MMNVRQFYVDVNGSYENALSIMMNDALISRMLAKFVNNNACEQMIKAYEDKDYRLVFTSAHTLKGVAGNLALTPLYELASIITEATRNSDDVNLDKEMAELGRLNNLIKLKYNEHIA